MAEKISELVEEPLGPVDVGGALGAENRDVNSPLKASSSSSEKKENTFYDQRTEMSREKISREASEEEPVDPLENVIPVEKLKNGAANAMEFLNWGISSLKEQAEKVQETESFKKLEEATQSVRERASSALEATKPKLNEFGHAVSERASDMYESARPTLEELGANAQKTLESAKEKVVQTTEACKPSVRKAAETANTGINNAYTETKSFIDKLTKE